MQFHTHAPSTKPDVIPAGNGENTYETVFAHSIDSTAHAFSFWKGRIALYAILKALGIGEGDEVILSGYTCIVVANAVRFTGATPVYADIAPDGYNLAPERVREAITKRTRAVVVQHTYGIPGPVYECLDLARRYHIDVIEDCAHAFGSSLDGRPLGSFGRAAFFSSQWSKPYTTGLGGMAVTRDPDLAGCLRKVHAGFVRPPLQAQWQLRLQYELYRNFFSPRLYWQAQSILQSFGRLGLFVGSSSDSELAGEMPVDHTWRMAESQHRAGMQKLKGFAQTVAHRRSIAALYDRSLAENGWPIPERPEGATILRYPVRVANKEELLAKARQAQIELGSWFETPLHPAPLAQHARFGFELGAYPNAERMAAQVVNLPVHEWITAEEAERILKFFYENASPLESDTVGFPVLIGSMAPALRE